MSVTFTTQYCIGKRTFIKEMFLVQSRADPRVEINKVFVEIEVFCYAGINYIIIEEATSIQERINKTVHCSVY